jgi:hypothetical protein
MRPRVYIAGPISKGPITENIRQAVRAANALIRAGYAPWVPQLTAYWEGHPPSAGTKEVSHAEWMEVDLPWVGVADAVLRLPGESKGADMEVRHALDHGVPVFFDLGSLLASGLSGVAPEAPAAV